MESLPVILLVLAVVAVIGGIGYLLWKREVARRERWAAWANERGWHYDHTRQRDIADYFGFVDRLRSGNNRYATDVLRGRWHDREALAFNYHYETQSTDSKGHTNTTDHWLWVAALQIERAFPELRISPEHIGKRFLHKFSGSDIDFESIEFSRAYEVKSADKRFAYDFCNSAMIDFLMANKGSVIELEGHWLVTYGDRKLELDEVEPLLGYLTRMRGNMPDYLFRPDYHI